MPNGTWISNASAVWSDSTRWSGGSAGIADGAGFTASFTNNIDAARTVTLDSARTIGTVVFSDGGVLSFGRALAGSSTLTLDNAPSAPVFNVITGATITCPVVSLTGFTKTGGAELTFSSTTVFQNNTGLTGPVIVAAGTLSANPWANRNANIPNSPTTVSGIAGASSLTVNAGCIAHISNANLSISYPITIQANAAVYAGGISGAGDYNQVISGEITGAGVLRLFADYDNLNKPVRCVLTTSSLPAQLQLISFTGAGDYRPVTYIYNGTGNTNAVDVIVDLWNTTTLENPATTFYVRNTSASNSTLTLRNILKSASLSGGLADAGSLNIGVAGDTGDITVTGAISEQSGNAALSLIKGGSRTLTLSGASTYAGTTTVNAGTLAVRHANALGGAGAVSQAAGGTIDIAGGITVAKSSSTFTLNSGGTTALNVPNDGLDNTLVSGALVLNSQLLVNVGSSAILRLRNTAAVQGSGVGLTKSGTGELDLGSFANTYTGPVTSDAGTITVGAACTPSVNGPLGNASSTVTVRGSSSALGAFGYNGAVAGLISRAIQLTGADASTSLAGLDASGTGAATFSNVTSTADVRDFYLTGTGTADNEILSNITVVPASGAIRKTGTGKWRITGGISTNNIAVSAGTLNLGGGTRTLSSTAVSMSGGTLSNDGATLECSGVSFTSSTAGTLRATLTGTSTVSLVMAAGNKGILYPESVNGSNGSNSYTGNTTIPTTTTLTLYTDANPATAGNGKVTGDSNVSVSGTLAVRAATQNGCARYGGNVTFGSGSKLRVGVAA